MDRLRELLQQIEGRGYKAYKRLEGGYDYPDFRLLIDHVQGDPFATPSRCRLLFRPGILAHSPSHYRTRVRRIALEDFLGRAFAQSTARVVRGKRGSGNSGRITIAPHGQEVLLRNAVLLGEESLEIRFQIGLPAQGRRPDIRQAMVMFFQELPEVVQGVLASEGESGAVRRHLDSLEDQQALRGEAMQRGLVAFIADGAILPRASGVDDRPLEGAIPFEAPDSLAVKLPRPNGEAVRGLGIPAGVTLIVGGGFHGKSTLLQAIERGVYDHIPGDGREFVVTDPSALKVRAEDGRSVVGVDIQPFINNLPQGRNTDRFTTANASGSTSQAAAIMEGIASGARTLLIDEDTSATNFMIRDQRMQQLVAGEKEPITPLVQRVHAMYRDTGVSVILVMGGSGDFFCVSDRVVMMDSYRPKDVTTEARALAGPLPPADSGEFPGAAGIAPRWLARASLDPRVSGERERLQAIDCRLLRYGGDEIDLSRVEQLVDNGQLYSIAYMLRALYAAKGSRELEIPGDLFEIQQQVEREGLDTLTPYPLGTLALPRIQELVATVNRMRKLRLVPAEE